MATAKKAFPPFPKTSGACIDAMYELDKRADGLQKQANALWAEYNALEHHLFETLSRSELNSAGGKLAKVEVKDVPYPNVEDWDRFWDHLVFGNLDVKKANAIIRGPQLNQLRKLILSSLQRELLQKRVGVEAWRERLDNKQVVPGTKVFNKVVIKLTAIKAHKQRKAA